MKKILLLLSILYSLNLSAQAPKEWSAVELYESIQKLNFLGSALYMAAHPDDENTRLIAYLANELKANTAYLSLTRGDGGQNLVGSEIRELLGVIRTQELLAARRLDGGQQFFSRANDFGYSKHPDETLKIWNEDEVMSDVIWVIRNFQPDIIVNRFDHRTPGRTHGHHTSSAMLSVRSFDMAADPNAYPEQLKYVAPWQPKRVFFNTSWFFYGSREKFKEADKSMMMSVDIGTYYPLKGKSNSEIAAESRSMHKSQGFGSTGTRGSQSDYLELIKGEMPSSKHDIFEGINTTWTRVENGAPIGEILKTVEEEFDFGNPAASVPRLLLAYNMMQTLEDSYWKRVKSKELIDVIEGCLGLYLEVVAENRTAVKGETLEMAVEVVQRMSGKIKLNSFEILGVGFDTLTNLTLEDNQKYAFYKQVTIPETIDVTNPYWLNNEAELGMYSVEDQLMRGKPETPRQIRGKFDLTIEGVDMTIERDVIFKRNDPVKGEVYQPFEIIAPVFASIANKVFIFPDNQAQSVDVTVKAGQSNLKGFVELSHPEGWKVMPDSIHFEIEQKDAEQTFTFQLTPPVEQATDQIVPKVTIGDQSYTDEIIVLDYDHIPTQTVVQDAAVKVVKIDLKKYGDRIGYIMGAGDDIPRSLQQIGYEVDLLVDNDLTPENLKQYDAVIVGVRAYNTNTRLKFHQSKLLEYVNQGGTMIVQYNTTRRLKIPVDEIGPYPLKLSRDRVAQEDAEIRFLAPDHPVLNEPNKITAADFENWVQERGLYFPNEWDENYTPILSSNDKGEPARDGGLLVAQYGSGYYIYSGYSWFRELPAGVPGAFRLFTNLVSIGKAPVVEVPKKKKRRKKKKPENDMSRSK